MQWGLPTKYQLRKIDAILKCSQKQKGKPSSQDGDITGESLGWCARAHVPGRGSV